MSSVSELSDEDVSISGNNVPSDAALERALRDAAFAAVKRGRADLITVNQIRTDTEKKLGLEAGYFKSSTEWGSRCKEIIRSSVADAEELNSHPSLPTPSPPPKPAGKQHSKRPSIDKPAQPRKRQKRTVSEDESDNASSAEVGELDSARAASKAGKNKAKSMPRKRKPSVVTSNPEEDVAGAVDPEEDKGGQDDEKEIDTAAQTNTADNMSESELSEVIDEPAVGRKQRQKEKPPGKGKSAAKSKAAKSTKSPAAKGQDLDPDEAEIKRLQSWLVKCGVRKLWHKELARYDTANAKIRHLKEMLKDVGMEGRFSEQKATAIKERRELAADLEAVQEGAKQWGHESDDEEETSERPAKRRGVASRFVDFGDDGDDSE